MATIKISELHPAGSELFQDSESFLNELTEQEIGGVQGGLFGFDAIKTVLLTLRSLSIETGIKTKVVSIKTKTVKTYGISYTLKTVIKL